jgi:hypothetical protein
MYCNTSDGSASITIADLIWSSAMAPLRFHGALQAYETVWPALGEVISDCGEALRPDLIEASQSNGRVCWMVDLCLTLPSSGVS